MKHCVDHETMSAYVDGALSSEEMMRIRSHLISCKKCAKLQEECAKENDIFSEWVSSPSLPEEFADRVRMALEKEEKRKQERGLKSRMKPMKWWKWLGASAAAVVLILAAMIWVSPTFASYLGVDLSRFGFFGPIDQKKNLVEEDLSVTDHGVTLKIIKLVANPNEVFALYEITKDGKPIHPFQFQDKEKRIRFAQPFLVDEKGKELNISEEGGVQGKYGYFAFRELPSKLPKKLFLEVRSNSFHGVRGDWNLRIPLKMEKAYSVKKRMDQTYTSPDGRYLINLKEIQYTNTRTVLTAWFGLTEKLRQEMEKQVLGRFESVDGEVYFTIVDDKGKIYAQNLPNQSLEEKKFHTSIRTLFNHSGNMDFTQQIQLPPLPKNQKFYFQLHSIAHEFESKEPFTYRVGANMTKELGQFTYTFQEGEIGDCNYNVFGEVKRDYTCLALKGKWQVKKGRFQILPKIPDLWKVTDDRGKSYMAHMHHAREDGNRQEFVMVVQGLNRVPKEVELRPWLLEWKRYEWKVPLPVEK